MSGLGEVKYAAADVYIPEGVSLYNRVGNWFAVILLFIIISMTFIHFTAKKR